MLISIVKEIKYKDMWYKYHAGSTMSFNVQERGECYIVTGLGAYEDKAIFKCDAVKTFQYVDENSDTDTLKNRLDENNKWKDKYLIQEGQKNNDDIKLINRFSSHVIEVKFSEGKFTSIHFDDKRGTFAEFFELKLQRKYTREDAIKIYKHWYHDGTGYPFEWLNKQSESDIDKILKK